MNEAQTEIITMREAHQRDLVAMKEELAGLTSLFDIVNVDNPILAAALQRRRPTQPPNSVQEQSEFDRAAREAANADLPDIDLRD